MSINTEKNIIGHSFSKHASYSVLLLVQVKPPYCWDGLLHFLVFRCCPIPHVTEHWVTCHLLHCPLTKNVIYEAKNCHI